MDPTTVVVQIIINIVAAGGAFALVAVGYTVVHATLKFINFQHGYMVALGAYLTYQMAIVWKWNFILSSVLAMILVAALGVLIEKVGYKPLRRASRLTPLLVSLGFASILQGVILVFWGPAVQTYRIPSTPIIVLGAVITSNEILMVLLSLGSLLALHLFLKRTKLGIAMRAVSDNLDAAAIIGINTDRVISSIFAVASALAALAGVLIGLEYFIQPTMGFPIIIRTLAAVTLGGIGSITGAIIGSFVIALVENLGVWFLNPAYREAYAYLILIAALLLRASGMLGGKRDRAA